MPSLRALLVAGLCVSASALVSSTPEQPGQNVDLDIQAFEDMLESLPAESLHAVLDDTLPKFQDGIFEAEHRAIEAIHSANPSLATKLVAMAQQDAVRAELVKRQNGTDTSSAAVDSSSTTAADAGSTAAAQPTSVVSSADTSVASSAPASSAAPSTTAPAPSSTEAAPSPSSGSADSESSVASPGSAFGGSSVSTVPATTLAVVTTDSAGNSVTSSQVIAASPTTISAAQSGAQNSGSGGGTTVGAGGAGASSAGASSAGASSAGASSASTQTGFLAPVLISSTDSAGSVHVETTSAFEAASQASVSVDVPVTTTNAQGATITTSSRVAAQVITATNAQGQAVTTTSALPSVLLGALGSLITSAASVRGSAGAASGRASDGADVTTTDQLGNTVVLSDVSYGEVVTATDARGSTFVTTYTPGGGRVSSLVLETITLPNGQRSTITSLAVIGGQAATSTQAAAASATSATKTGTAPGLQSGIASANRGYAKEVVAVIGGAIGVAYLL